MGILKNGEDGLWFKHQDNLKRDNEKNETRLFIGFNLVF